MVGPEAGLPGCIRMHAHGVQLPPAPHQISQTDAETSVKFEPRLLGLAELGRLRPRKEELTMLTCGLVIAALAAVALLILT